MEDKKYIYHIIYWVYDHEMCVGWYEIYATYEDFNEAINACEQINLEEGAYVPYEVVKVEVKEMTK